MPILQVIKYGDPLLRKKVQSINDIMGLSLLIDNMFETMYNEKGIGLAANQVGKSINLFITDTTGMEDEENLFKPMIFINSSIINSEGEFIMEEGCLSIPEIRAKIARPEKITLKFQDENEKWNENVYTGIMSRVIQHEIDHLNGKYFIDYLPAGKRLLLQKRLLEISKTGTPDTGIIL